MEGGFLNSPRAKCSKGFPLAFLSIQAQIGQQILIDLMDREDRYISLMRTSFAGFSHHACIASLFVYPPSTPSWLALSLLFFFSFVTLAFIAYVCIFIREKKCKKDLDCINFLYQLFKTKNEKA